MTHERRAGASRRNEQVRAATERWFGDDRRDTRDRRELMRDPDITIGRLRRIPLFSELSMPQYSKILSICSKLTLSPGDTLCTSGNPADMLFFLVNGTLRITFQDGRDLSRVAPKEIIGKLGFFTGQQHTATVSADSDCTVISISRTELMRVLQADQELWVHLLTNLVTQLTDLLKENTNVIRDMNNINSLEIL